MEPLLGRVEAEAEAASDTVRCDEGRLAELGRCTVEMYVMSHIFLEKIAVSILSAQTQRAWTDYCWQDASRVPAHTACNLGHVRSGPSNDGCVC